MGIILGILEQGLIYAILALGVYITYRILDFPDLSVDSTFPLGAAVTGGYDRQWRSSAAYPARFVDRRERWAGMVTGLIHVKGKVRDLLSGIITMTALYSINLRIAGKANLPIFNMNTLFKNPLMEAACPPPSRPMPR